MTDEGIETNNDSKIITNIDLNTTTENRNLYILEASQPKDIYQNFLKQDISIEDFIMNLPFLNTKQMKRLFALTINRKIETKPLVLLTKERDRNVRTISTMCCLNRGKAFLIHAKKNKDFEGDIMQIYDEVFLHRCKDIDFAIRASCYEHLCEFIMTSDLFRKKEFIRALLNGLEDKNDSVRRKTMKGCVKIFERILNQKQNKQENEKVLRMFADVLKDKIYFRCQNEANPRIRGDSVSLLVRFFRHQFCDKDEIMNVLSNFGSKEVGDLYLELKSGNGAVKALLELFECDPESLNKLDITSEDRDTYIEYLNTVEECSEGDLDILLRTMNKEFGKINDIYVFMKKFKYLHVHINKMISVLNIIEPDKFTINHGELVDHVIAMLQEHSDPELVKNTLGFLKRVHKIFPSKVDFFIENIKYKRAPVLIKYAIRNFDLSEVVSSDDVLEVKVLAYLWQIKNSNYFNIQRYEFVIDTKDDLMECSNFLVYCHGILETHNSLDMVYEMAYDPVSSIKILFDKLKSEIMAYFSKIKMNGVGDTKEFNFKETLKRRKTKTMQYDAEILDCFSRTAHVIKSFDLLFFCDKSKIIDCIQKLESIEDSFIDSFFSFLMMNEYNLADIKVITMAITRKARRLNVFDWLKKLHDKKVLYDNCLIYFTKYLDGDDCQSLYEQINFNCKYKKTLEKKMKEAFTFSEKENATNEVIRF